MANSIQQKWNTAYRTFNDLWGSEPTSYLQRIVKKGKLSYSNALDYGCGIGRNAVFLAQRGLTVTAVDISEEALRLARQSLPTDLAGRIRFMKPEDDWDTTEYGIVLCFGVLHGYPPCDAKKIVLKLLKVMGPNGFLLC